ncbi:VOC family protein [Methylobacterium oxalidis]|nr:lactoylglutathione lyase [Methylobacterium oxalidis]GJE32527.1 hypothetical protein LDDCCGHA_2713 [Methylobacterium oxalidis]
MPQMIFVNLPVRDVARATAFYEAVGASKNPNFSNDDASCMVFSDVIHVMLLSHAFFSTFTTKAIPDARETCQVLICISQESREAVDAMVARAEAAGGRADPGPKQDYGFMYGRSFEDLDGHVWEISWMDPVAAQKGPEAHAAANA